LSFNRPKLQIDLRSLLIWMFFAAIGLAMGTSPRFSTDPDFSNMGLDPPPSVNWFNALLGAASAGIVWGLIRQARAIRRQSTSAAVESMSLRTSARWEATLRAILAVVIALCMTIQLLTMQRFFKLPEREFYFYGDAVTQYLWWFAILAALTDAFIRARPKLPQKGCRILNGVFHHLPHPSRHQCRRR